jgi:hypothetical protein
MVPVTSTSLVWKKNLENPIPVPMLVYVEKSKPDQDGVYRTSYWLDWLRDRWQYLLIHPRD